MSRLKTFALSTLLAIGMPAPAFAAPAPSAKLVDCGSESCLQVSGHRDKATSEVSINGHVVAAQGARKWRLRLPVNTVRAWSEPYARTISVSVAGAEHEADLPIGMLGHTGNLAMLVVRVK